MRTKKSLQNLITILACVSLPFWSACASWHTAGISNGLRHGKLTYEGAKEEIAAGANVKDGWADHRPFIQYAAEQKRWDLVELFVENGASCFNAPGGYKRSSFSLFEFVVYNRPIIHGNNWKFLNEFKRLELLDLCLEHANGDLIPAKEQIAKFVRSADFSNTVHSKMLLKIRAAGFETDKIPSATELLCEYVCGTRKIALSISELVKFGAVPNAKDEKGNSLLFVAASRGDVEMVKKLQNVGAKMSADEATKLLVALVCRNEQVVFSVPELVKFGANPSTQDENGNFLLFIATSRGNIEIAKELQNSGAKISADEATKLLLECIRGNEQIVFSVPELVELGADSNAKYENGDSLLFVAASRGNAEIVKGLQEAGTKMSADEATKLLISKIYGNEQIKIGISELINFGANVNASIEGKHSLLFFANSRGLVEESKYLHSAGAKMSANEATELLISKICGNEKIKMSISGLVKFGADVNARTKEGKSLLFISMLNKNEDFEQKLLVFGAKETNEIVALRERIAEEKRKEQELAAQKEKLKSIEDYFVKIDKGKWDEISNMIKNEHFDISVVHPGINENGFHRIARCENLEPTFIKALKDAGVNINMKNTSGYSPLAIAIGWDNSTAVKLFLQNGANANDFIVEKGKFGDTKKSLVDYAIERHNNAVNDYNRWIRRKNDILTGRYRPDYIDVAMDVADSQINIAKKAVNIRKEIIHYLSQVTGTGVSKIGDFSK